MFKLLPITAICLILTAFSHAASTYDPIECRYYKKDRFWYAIMAVCLILFAGLRTDYNDTGTYLEGYQKYRDGLYSYENIDWLSIGNNPGFVYVMGLMIRMNFHESAFIMCFSIFMVVRRLSNMITFHIVSTPLFGVIGAWSISIAWPRLCRLR